MSSSNINLDQLVETILALQDQIGRLEARQNHVPFQSINETPSTMIIPLSNDPFPTGVKFQKPSSYEGQQRQLDAWLYEVELYYENLAMPESRKIGYAVSLLRGTALLWWKSKSTRGEISVTWDHFKSSIRSQFQPKNAYRQARDRLRHLQQTTSVSTYNSTFNIVCLDIPDLSDAEVLDKYLAGLKPQTRTYVELENPHSLEEAMSIADRYDNITFSTKVKPSSIPTFKPQTFRRYEPNQPPSSDSTTPMELDRIDVRPSLSEKDKETLRKNGLCFYCKERGHMAITCPKRISKQEQQSKAKAQ
jgi:Ty3 transposon capsid-like protein